MDTSEDYNTIGELMRKHWENSKGKDFFWTQKPRAEQPKQWSSDANAEFYHSTAWRKCRASYIHNNPACEICYKKGYMVKADVVDHIQPIRLGGERLDADNLQSLCHSCHNSKSAKERHEHSKNDI